MINSLSEEFKPQDITESIHLDINDELINNSDPRLIAYNIRMKTLEGEKQSQVYDPKNFPNKAINIVLTPKEDLKVNIFLDTEKKEWDSLVNDEFKLSPDQMGDFFSTEFYKKINKRVKQDWPLTDDFYKSLYNAIDHKKVCLDPVAKIDEDGEFNKINIDKEKSREKNAAGTQKRTNSGRKIVTFSDFGVEKKDQARYFCWPKIDSEFKWSQWNIADKLYDAKKTNPMFIRLQFYHAGYQYGGGLSLFKEVDNNRGWRFYNLDILPRLQWVTPIEASQILELSLIKKFIKTCKTRIENYISMSTEDILDHIKNKDKITADQIEETKKLIKRNIELLRNPRADTYVYD